MAASQTYVVMFGGVSNFVRGCRVTIDDMYHADLPGRDACWQRLIDLGAIKPESDPEAAAVPMATPWASPPPIVPAGNNLSLLTRLLAVASAPGSAVEGS